MHTLGEQEEEKNRYETLNQKIYRTQKKSLRRKKITKIKSKNCQFLQKVLRPFDIITQKYYEKCFSLKPFLHYTTINLFQSGRIENFHLFSSKTFI